MNRVKGMLKSRTFWTNLLMGILSIIDEGTIKCVSPDVKAIIVAGVNIILRAITTESIAIKGEKKNAKTSPATAASA